MRQPSPRFFDYHVLIHSMGFRPFHPHSVASSTFPLGRYICEGRSYYLRLKRCPAERALWNTTLVFFYDPKENAYPCVKTMIKAHNHFALEKARSFLEMLKVFELCS